MIFSASIKTNQNADLPWNFCKTFITIWGDMTMWSYMLSLASQIDTNPCQSPGCLSIHYFSSSCQ